MRIRKIMNEFFKVLADETRLRCLTIIFKHQEVCVCELVHSLALPQSKISRHLAIIKLNQIIQQRREGQWVLYSGYPQLESFKKRIIQQTIEELIKTSPFKEDQQRLLAMTSRPAIKGRGVKHV